MTESVGIVDTMTHGARPPACALTRWLVVVALVCGASALLGLPARATYGARTTADEPQYLLSAISLAADADLDISDEIAEQSYLDFHEIPIDEQTRLLNATSRRVSPHDPLLPVVLAGPMALGGWAVAKASLTVVAAATGALTVWIAVRRFGIGAKTAAIVAIACFGGLPLAAYGTQVYPEMPAAFALCIATALVTAPSRRSQRHRVTMMLASAAAIVALPWLSIKYVPMAFVAGLALMWRARGRRAELSLIVLVGAIAGVVYLGSHQWIYGGWTAYASGDHFAQTGEFAVVGTQIDVLGRARRLPGLLVDRRFGLAAWSPVWLLLTPAVGAVVRRARRRELFLVALVGAAWLNATFVALTMHGWWVPGRQLVAALPVAAILLALWVDEEQAIDEGQPNDRSPRRLALTAVLGMIGVANWGWLAIEASTGRRTLVVDFFDTNAPGFRLVGPILPDGLRSGPGDTALLVLWTAIILGGAFAGWHRSPRDSVRRRRPR